MTRMLICGVFAAAMLPCFAAIDLSEPALDARIDLLVCDGVCRNLGCPAMKAFGLPAS